MTAPHRLAITRANADELSEFPRKENVIIPF
eukprot:CAMPEP_0195517684 /NCGR_PEP_ID=MMETSP0794_2-20130614/11298_1 /TAXON_ID=515487 /ORGANISM="Stephanopyxis turris, Strain CCMP 815" /LENGTH=30 /DNA_ID= /DNA_START= /DNA_END= /DNA_ORIENTATION=